MRITITVDGTAFTGTLDDNAATRSLLDLLPVALEMADHGGVEKTGRLPAPLALDGLPSGADPGVGDIGYYAPGQDLVLYHGDQASFDGIVVLGRLDGGVDTLTAMRGDVSVSVRSSD